MDESLWMPAMSTTAATVAKTTLLSLTKIQLTFKTMEERCILILRNVQWCDSDETAKQDRQVMDGQLPVAAEKGKETHLPELL